MITKNDHETIDEYKARIRARHLQRDAIEAFGEKHSLSKWAQLLGLPKTSLWRYLQRGLTVEEVCALRDIPYPAVNN
ncbi:MAG: hypothetical protein IKY89_05525 [Alistipes sp.]|nr:hypothetical protein [Alistipes sp.]